MSTFGLAPALLARFPNGLLYRFVHGQVCSAQELSYEPVWRGVARRLGQWHAVVPLLLGRSPVSKSMLYYDSGWSSKELCLDIVDADMITPGKPMPNIWTVMSTWIRALPDGTAPQVGTWKLGNELLKLVQELGDIPGIGRDGVSVALATSEFRSLLFNLLPSVANDSSAGIWPLRLALRKRREDQSFRQHRKLEIRHRIGGIHRL